MRDVLIGQTDYTVPVRMASTTGAPVTGLTHSDIDIAFVRFETDNDVVSTDVSPASLSALTDAHSDWGWKEVSSTDHPGLYRLDIADAVFASGAWEAVVTITDASGTDFYATDIGFRLVGQDKTAATYAANVTAINGNEDAPQDLTAMTAAFGANSNKMPSVDGSGAALATAANQTTILNRLGAFTGTGVNTVLGFLKAMFSKTATTPSDVGGTADAATDSLEALADAGEESFTEEDRTQLGKIYNLVQS